MARDAFSATAWCALTLGVLEDVRGAAGDGLRLGKGR